MVVVSVHVGFRSGPFGLGVCIACSHEKLRCCSSTVDCGDSKCCRLMMVKRANLPIPSSSSRYPVLILDPRPLARAYRPPGCFSIVLMVVVACVLHPRPQVILQLTMIIPVHRLGGLFCRVWRERERERERVWPPLEARSARLSAPGTSQSGTGNRPIPTPWDAAEGATTFDEKVIPHVDQAC